jgi:hypothetical protein
MPTTGSKLVPAASVGSDDNGAAYVVHTTGVAGERDVVEAHSVLTPGHEMHSREISTTDLGNGILRISGQELISAVSQPGDAAFASSLPAGGVMLAVPANPRLIEGCRVAKMLEMYDQFRFVKVTFEYHPVVSAFSPGQLVMGYVNDASDALTSETGFQAVRDLYTRAGAVMFNVAAGAKCTLGHPLLKWYYTANQTLPQLDLPGMVVVQTTQPLVGPIGANPVSYGLVTMSYEIDVRAPTIEEPDTPIYTFTSGSLNMSPAAVNQGGPISIDAVAFPAFAPVAPGYVQWGTIVAADDSGPASPAWRRWNDSGTEIVRLLGPGNILYWRTVTVGATIRMYFFSNLIDAMAYDQVGAGSAWSATTTVLPGTTKGFKLWNISGFRPVID